jgi:hypothetical protein
MRKKPGVRLPAFWTGPATHTDPFLRFPADNAGIRLYRTLQNFNSVYHRGSMYKFRKGFLQYLFFIRL